MFCIAATTPQISDVDYDVSEKVFAKYTVKSCLAQTSPVAKAITIQEKFKDEEVGQVS